MTSNSKKQKTKIKFSQTRVTYPGDPVAIIGLGAVMPDANNIEEFWENVRTGRDSIREVPKERWDPELYYDEDRNAPDKTYSKIGSWITDFEFNSVKFRIPPKVAKQIDPVQQMALEAARQALEGANINNENTAVILGNSMGGEIVRQYTRRVYFPEVEQSLKSTEEFKQLDSKSQQSMLIHLKEKYLKPLTEITEDSMPGELANVIAGRVANVFNLRGKNMTTDAACASSIAAVDQAYKSLVSGEVDAVLCGGADRSNEISSFVKFCKIGALSPDGSRPFDKDANGFIMGEGVGFFLMKRLEDAIRDGDTIYAIIRGVGSSSDGKGKGITAPNPIGQELAIRRALTNAGVTPEDISLIEAHGTSTAVGDVVEVATLQKVFSEANLEKRSIALGSIKSQIGHLKSAAGSAAVLKVALSLYNKTLPPSINFKVPNPKIDWDNSPFYVNTQAKPWDHDSSKTRKAGVSAFGFGGTNFHLIMEEYNPNFNYFPDRKIVEALDYNTYMEKYGKSLGEVFTFSSSDSNQLKDQIKTAISKVPSKDLTEDPAAMTLAEVREKISTPNSESLVLSFAATNVEALKKNLEFASSVIDKESIRKGARARGIFYSEGIPTGKLAFLFPGQGSQYVNMLADLASRYPVVKETFDEADEVLEEFLGKKLSSLVFSKGDTKKAEEVLKQTQYTQPAMLTADIALFRLFKEFGVEPDMVAGHSLGEYAALVAAEVLSFPDALMAVAIRGKAMSDVDADDKGTMASISGSLDEVVKILEEEVEGYAIAANKNSTKRVVISGSTEGVQEAIKVFTEKKIKAIKLNVSAAFHTKIVAPAAETLAEYLRTITFSRPKIPVSSNVLGDFYPEDPEKIRELLEKQVESPVEWTAQTESMYNAGARLFFEVGPKRALASFVAEILDDKEIVSVVTNHPKKGGIYHFCESLAALIALGYDLTDAREDEAFKIKPKIEKTRVPVRIRADPQPVSAPIAVRSTESTVDITPMIDKDIHSDPLFEEFMKFQGQAFSSFVRESFEKFKMNYAGHGSESSLLDKYGINLDKIVVTGTGVGLPGKNKEIFDPENIRRILRGDNLIDPVGEAKELQQTDKNINRLVKSKSGGGSFLKIDSRDNVIKLAGQPGTFDLVKEYQIAEKMVGAYDITTKLAIAAGLEALKDAGIPLVRQYNKTTTGGYLPGDWVLPPDLQENTGVIFASAFPGFDSLVEDISHFYQNKYAENAIDVIRKVYGEVSRRERKKGSENPLLDFLDAELEDLEKHRSVFEFNRKFLFRILSMGHSQFAQLIKAYGPNTQTNAACASTTQAVGIAEDWIRNGRCERVIIISADNVSGENLFEWIGSGFLISGAATTEGDIKKAALPFDRRRNGMIVGMGAVGLVIETRSEARRRGVAPIVEIIGTHYANSAFHGTRLDVAHITAEMKKFMNIVAKQTGLTTSDIAKSCMFMSHETYTPARGGSAAAEINSIRETFGEDADKIVVANTKGFTGHPMGAGIEDAIAIKALELGVVPPIANFQEPDESLGNLRLSKGEKIPLDYAFRIAAGFGSQLAFALYRKASTGERKSTKYNEWLKSIGGSVEQLVNVGKTLRLKDNGIPPKIAVAQSTRSVAKPVKEKARPTPSVVTYSGSVMQVLSQKTGYPESMLMDNLSLKNDLGLSEHDVKEILGNKSSQYKEDLTVGELNSIATGTVSLSSGGKKSTKPSKSTPARVSAPKARQGNLLEDILDRIAESTGYPKETLDVDMDLEADLGIDTVKQAEIFGDIRESYGIPFDENLDLGEYNTIRKIEQFVKDNTSGTTGSAQPVTETPTSSSPTTSSLDADEVLKKVLDTIAEQSGYPLETLDPDLDMEADLGIDTVKQAEIFGEVREQYDIPFDENLDLGEYNTIRKVAQFVMDNAGKGGQPTTAEQSATLQSTQTSVTSENKIDPEEIMHKVLSVVSEATGYALETLDPDLDMEADLGIDTVKQAEIFGEIREMYGIPFDENIDLADYNTIAKVGDFVKNNISSLTEKVTTTARIEETTKTIPKVSSEDRGAILEKVVSVIASETGYPPEMLDLDLDLEADLGVDTVKQAEIIGLIREEYSIPFDENLDLGDVSTINKMVDFVLSYAGSMSSSEKQSTPEPVKSVDENRSKEILDVLIAKTSALTGYPDSLIAPTTDVKVDLGATDQQYEHIISETAKHFGLSVPSDFKPEPTLDKLAEQLAIREDGSAKSHKYLIRYVPSDDYKGIELNDPVVIGELEELGNTISGINAYDGGDLVIIDPTEKSGSIPEYYKVLKEHVDKEIRLVLLIHTEKASLHSMSGYQGALGGLFKALDAEFNNISSKIIVSSKATKEMELREIKNALGQEVILDGNIRKIVSLLEVDPEFREFKLPENSSIIVSGGAQGITFACLKEIVSTGVNVALLGRTEIRDDAPEISSLDEKALKERKQKLLDELKENNERVTPVMLEKEWSKYTKSAAVFSAIKELESMGAKVVYKSVDVRDADRMKQAVSEIVDEFGEVHYIIHGAGVEISKPTKKKSVEEFDMVYGIKMDGFENILQGVDLSKIKRIMAFSSVAGRFGNATQADYSAANEYLAKRLAQLNSETTVASVIDWSAWEGVGMATRGSTLKVLSALGVTPIPFDEGVQHFVEEFGYGAEPEVVVSGELGGLASKVRFIDKDPSDDEKSGEEIGEVKTEQEETKSKETESKETDSEETASEETESEDLSSLVAKADEGSTQLKSEEELEEFPMIDCVFKTADNITARRVISLQRDLYLDHHRIDGKAVLPGVMGLEFMAETGAILGGSITEFRNIEFKSPIKLPRDKPLEISAITSASVSSLSLHFDVKSKFIGPDGKQLGDLREHFSAELVDKAMVRTFPVLDSDQLQWFAPEEPLISKEKIYEIFFHGPKFQVLSEVLALGKVSVGTRYSLPENEQFRDVEYEKTKINPLVIEACFQTAGMYDLLTNKRMSLPAGIKQVKLYKNSNPVEYVFAVFLREEDGHSIYHVQALDKTGSIVIDLHEFSMIHTGKVKHKLRFKHTYDLDIATVKHLVGSLGINAVTLSIDAFGGISNEFLEEFLTESERLRLDKLKVKKRRLEWLSGIIASKLVLGIIHNIREPDITIIRDEEGRPYGLWGDSKYPLSKTHSNGIVIAVSMDKDQFGIDLEKNVKRKKSIIKTAFTQKEQDMYGIIPDNSDVINAMWTAKEAALKADGTGLRDNLLKTKIKGDIESGLEIKTPLGVKQVTVKSTEKWVLSFAKSKD